MDSKKLPLAFVCHPYHRGGVTQWMADAAAEWAGRGNPCWFVTPKPARPFISGRGRPTMLELLELARAHSALELVTPPAGRAFDLGSRRWRAHVYASAIVDGVPAGVPVIVSDDEPVWRAASWCHQRNPMIGVLHGDDPHYYDLARRYAGEVAALVAVSQRVRQQATKVLGDERVQMAAIPCGVPLAAPRASARWTGSLRLLWIGRIEEERKRASDIVNVARELAARGREFTLGVIGDGPARPELQRRALETGLETRVRFRGWLDRAQIRAALNDADILLSTSNYEGMPVVVMEALAAGCAVVASRVSGVEDHADRPEAIGCLWTYQRGAVAAAATAIDAVASHPREEIAERARAFASAEFSIDRCMDRYESLLRELRAATGAQPRLWLQRLAAAGSPVLALARSLRATLRPSARVG